MELLEELVTDAVMDVVEDLRKDDGVLALKCGARECFSLEFQLF